MARLKAKDENIEKETLKSKRKNKDDASSVKKRMRMMRYFPANRFPRDS